MTAVTSVDDAPPAQFDSPSNVIEFHAPEIVFGPGSRADACLTTNPRPATKADLTALFHAAL